MISENIRKKLSRAGKASREYLGREVTFYLPGMFRIDSERGKYPAISITGDSCELGCDHCRGEILRSMPSVLTPRDLLDLCRNLWALGNLGVLLSGGCRRDGTLPWEDFLPAIGEIKKTTGMKITVHCGLIDERQALALKKAGVDQALLDVIGSQETWSEVCHLKSGLERQESTLMALKKAELQAIPHLVVGLHYGKIKGEYQALELLERFQPGNLVLVVLRPIRGTPMERVDLPTLEEIAGVLTEARRRFPLTRLCLGCARPRGPMGEKIELLALEAGINGMALFSDITVAEARSKGLEIIFRKTCCSLQ